MNSQVDVAASLSDLFREKATFTLIKKEQIGDAVIAIAEVSIARDETLGSRSKQTVLFFEQDPLHFPEFKMHARPTGVPEMLVRFAGDWGNLEFPQHPKFEQIYTVHSWAADATRQLFGADLTQHAEENPGWEIRARKSKIAVFQPGELHDEAKQDKFVKDALEWIDRCRDAEASLADHAGLRRDWRPSDVVEAAQRMDGIIGNSIRKQLNKIKLTQSEIDQFIASPIPRKIPKGMRNQVLGQNFPMVIIGLVFVFAGLIGGAIWVANAQGWLKLGSLFLFVVPPAIGSLMSYLTWTNRSQKSKVLRSGTLTTGMVHSVKSCNLEMRGQKTDYVVKIGVDSKPKKTVGEVTVQESQADWAREAMRSKTPVQILVDPQDSKSIVCIDLLFVFDEPSN